MFIAISGLHILLMHCISCCCFIIKTKDQPSCLDLFKFCSQLGNLAYVGLSLVMGHLVYFQFRLDLVDLDRVSYWIAPVYYSCHFIKLNLTSNHLALPIMVKGFYFTFVLRLGFLFC